VKPPHNLEELDLTVCLTKIVIIFCELIPWTLQENHRLLLFQWMRMNVFADSVLSVWGHLVAMEYSFKQGNGDQV
jgi:hypothetical protein